jgi:hypothetical protein
LETVMNQIPDLSRDFHGFIILIPADRKSGLLLLSKNS